MNSQEAKRTFLKLFIGFLSLTALIAIYSVLGGRFGELQIKVLITTFTISTASICSMSCAAFIEKKKQKEFGLAGIACSAVAASLVIGGVWLEAEEEAYWKSAVSLIVISLAFAHSFLLMLPKLDTDKAWAQKASSAAISLLALQIIIAIWGEIDDRGYYKLLTVVSIIVVLLTLVIPILMKMRKEEDSPTKTLTLTETTEGTFVDETGAVYRVTKVDPSNEQGR